MSDEDLDILANGGKPGWMFLGHAKTSVVPFDAQFAMPHALAPTQWPLWDACKAPLMVSYKDSPIYVTDPAPYNKVNEKKAKANRRRKKAGKRTGKNHSSQGSAKRIKISTANGNAVKATSAPPCSPVGQIVTNPTLEEKFRNWDMPSLAALCVQMILLTVANYTLPDAWINQGGEDIINSQRTLAKNLVSLICFYYGTGQVGAARWPGKYETIKVWMEKPGNEAQKARFQQMKAWVLDKFGPETEELRDELAAAVAAKKSSRGRSKGSAKKGTIQRVGNDTRFGMTLIEAELESVKVVNFRDQMLRKLKEQGVASVESWYDAIQKKEDLEATFFKAVPLPLALIYNALVPTSKPSDWKCALPAWQVDICKLNLKWKTAALDLEEEEEEEDDISSSSDDEVVLVGEDWLPTGDEE